MAEFEGRDVVITGGARGIGKAIAVAFADAGARVAILDIDEDGATATASRIGRNAIGRRVDVRSEVEVDGAFEALLSAGYRCDILVNDAAIQREGALADQTLDDYHAVVDTNLLGTFLCSRAALRPMLARGSGVIINLSSILGLTGDALLPVYAATKHAILGLTKSTAVAYARQGIRCVAICPGDVDTELNQQYFAAQPDPVAFRERVEREYPARRMARPDEIARVAIVLATEDASFVNGSHVVVDGGLLARPFDLY